MHKSELFTQAFLHTLGGMAANPQNNRAKAADLVEAAFNCAAIAANRYSQIVNPLYPTAWASVGSSATDIVTITYSADASGQVNTTPEIIKESRVPTAVKQPDAETSVAQTNVLRGR